MPENITSQYRLLHLTQYIEKTLDEGLDDNDLSEIDLNVLKTNRSKLRKGLTSLLKKLSKKP